MPDFLYMTNPISFHTRFWLLLAAALPMLISSGLAARTMSREDRVACAQAVESVYWKNRIWPSQNPEPKPAIDDLIVKTEVLHKVDEVLRMTSALQGEFGLSISADELEQELVRMLAQSRAPDVLNELLRVLDNDPVLAAECLARPHLTRQKLEASFRRHSVEHKTLRAEVDLAIRSQMAQRSGIPSPNRLVLQREKAEPTDGIVSPGFDLGRRVISDNDWQSLKLWLEYSALPPGATSAPPHKWRVREDDETIMVVRPVQLGKRELVLDTWRFEKLSFSDWWASRRELHQPADLQPLEVSDTLRLLKTAPSAAMGTRAGPNEWLTRYAPPPRSSHSSVWTGSEMIIWGGSDGLIILRSGASYEPATDTWTYLDGPAALGRRAGHAAVWTGSEMILRGGYRSQAADFCVDDTWAYAPDTRAWRALPSFEEPLGCTEAVVAWTGSELIVWGGWERTALASGALYSPLANQWRAMESIESPGHRSSALSAWTGNELLIWGGSTASDLTNEGFRFEPVTNSWAPMSNVSAPSVRVGAASVWTGSEFLVWGGGESWNECYEGPQTAGGRYDPATDQWLTLEHPDYISPRCAMHGVWTGDELLWVGGFPTPDTCLVQRHEPDEDQWQCAAMSGAPPVFAGFSAVWSGTELILWSGQTDDYRVPLNQGSRYEPKLDRWRPMTTALNLRPRAGAGAAWTGAELVVWGGVYWHWSAGDGAKYDPALDAWSSLPMTDAPNARYNHKALWTGLEVLISGGEGYAGSILVQSSYRPGSNSWQLRSLAPTGIGEANPVWSGEELLVWGTPGGTTFQSNRGARFHPDSNTWIEMSSINAPTARNGHSAVWANGAMLVWGGWNQELLADGGGYDPTTDAWSELPAEGAPSARTRQQAVWTGSEMVIWGGQGVSMLLIGAAYDPLQNAWRPMSQIDGPPGSFHQPMVWTGDRLLVWGNGLGFDSPVISPIYAPSLYLEDLAFSYNPLTDTWEPLPGNPVPQPRYGHSLVWAGDRLLVWGGSGANYLNDLWQYFPAQVDDAVGWRLFRSGFE